MPREAGLSPPWSPLPPSVPGSQRPRAVGGGQGSETGVPGAPQPREETAALLHVPRQAAAPLWAWTSQLTLRAQRTPHAPLRSGDV